MKKIFALVFATVLLFVNSVDVFALGSGVSSFSITPIEADQKYKYIKINITAPKKQTNSKLLVGFYVNGTLTKLTPLDVSSQTSFKNKTIDTAVLVKSSSGNYYKDLTPDEIKIFTWNKNNLAPKTLCDNVLTPQVIKKANAEVVESLKLVPEATMFIRENHLTWEEDYLDGFADTWDTHLFPIMDYIDTCAKGAITDAETHLLTSLFAQNRYYDELSQIRNLLNSAPPEQKSKISDLLDPTALGKEYYNALNNATKFLDFSLTEI